MSVEGIGTHNWKPGCIEHGLVLSAGLLPGPLPAPHLVSQPRVSRAWPSVFVMEQVKGNVTFPSWVSLLLEGPRFFAFAVSYTWLVLRAAWWDPLGHWMASGGQHLTRRCDRNDDTWNRNNPKGLSLHSCRIPRVSLEPGSALLHHLVCHSSESVKQFWQRIINRTSPVDPPRASLFRWFPAFRIAQAEHRQKGVSKTAVDETHLLATWHTNRALVGKYALPSLPVGKTVPPAMRFAIHLSFWHSTEIHVPLFKNSRLFQGLQRVSTK